MTKQRMTVHAHTTRLLSVCSLCLVCGLAARTLQAQTTQPDQKPVSKVAVPFDGTNIVAQSSPDGPGYQDLVSAQVQTVQTNDLLINLGLQLRLQTSNTPGSEGDALLNIIVYVDGGPVSPQFIKYGHQRTFLNPGAAGSFLLGTVETESFSFLTGDLPPGVHTIRATAYLVATGSGNGSATGSVGDGTMTVETVHVITGPSDIPTLK